ncbi:MAG: hypothetical protein J6B13_02125 [Muribaculaceae bacterium]|nr:hypothetical protein [Muribaculaceae bacterium]
MRSALLSQKFHTSAAAAIMIAVAALYVLATGGLSSPLPQQPGQGLCLPPVSTWNLGYWGGLVANVGLNAAIMAMMIVINKTYNVLRAVTRMQVGLFAIMQAAVPSVVVTLNSGTLVALTILCCIYLMFSCYDSPGYVKRVFLTFMLLSLGATVQYCFVLFIPVFWVICAQMRILRPRTFVASLLGIITVWWLLFGFGIITPADVHVPVVTRITEPLDLSSAIYLLIVTGFTAFVLVASVGLNVLKTIAYNARARSYNGALTLIALVTILAMLFDYNNLVAYLPLLNVCAAYQLTHYFVRHRFDRQYAAVLSVCAVYIMLYLWRVAL